MNKEELRKDWEMKIAEFKASGQTQAKWCAAHNLNIHQLRYWLKRFRSNGTTETTETKTLSDSKWLPIDISEQQGSNNSLLVKVGEFSIEVQSGYDPALFLDVVRKLKSLC